jgi:Secretion system C-terminal sorting domain
MKNQNLGTAVGQVNIASNNCNIYPNPTTDLFSVSSEAPILHLKVFDAMGCLVSESAGTGIETSVDLTGNMAGVYFVKAETAGGVYSFKVLRE